MSRKPHDPILKKRSSLKELIERARLEGNQAEKIALFLKAEKLQKSLNAQLNRLAIGRITTP